MIVVRYAKPQATGRFGNSPSQRSVEFGEKMKMSGTPAHNRIFRHQYESTKMFLEALSSIDCNAKATCKVSHEGFSADGEVEVWDAKHKEILDEAIGMLMQIGSHAKRCKGSSFRLAINQKISKSA
jgi:hypothetical protein